MKSVAGNDLNPEPHRSKLPILWLCLLLLSAPGFAAETGKPPALFKDPSELKITLKGPWRKVKSQIKKDFRYPAQLIYNDVNGQQRILDVEVAPRGISRRNLVCKFPPLKVYFDRKKTKGTAFRGNKSLKLVSYCQTSPKYEQYNIKEFLIYRIYNLITAMSFRVKPLVVDYVDNEKKGKSVTRFGFLIEDIDAVAKRNKMKKLVSGKVSVRQLDPAETSKFMLFQYLVGNLDWSATSGKSETRCCHNSRAISTHEHELPKYMIPYDFDSTGLVSTHYSVPPLGLKAGTNIRRRLYRGFCAHNDFLPKTVELFHQERANIVALFSNDSHLNDRIREKAIAYIGGFYKLLDDPKRFKSNITDMCRG